MRKLRTFFGIDDDLQAFAQDWLNRPDQLAAPLSLTCVDGAMVTKLYCDGKYQVELCAVPGGLVIPPHIHPHMDTIEVGLSGALRLEINGVDPYAGVPDERLERHYRGRGIRINATDWHGTTVGMPGSMFLSIQRWAGTPTSVLTDYVGSALGPQHEAILC